MTKEDMMMVYKALAGCITMGKVQQYDAYDIKKAMTILEGYLNG